MAPAAGTRAVTLARGGSIRVRARTGDTGGAALIAAPRAGVSIRTPLARVGFASEGRLLPQAQGMEEKGGVGHEAVTFFELQQPHRAVSYRGLLCMGTKVFYPGMFLHVLP